MVEGDENKDGGKEADAKKAYHGAVSGFREYLKKKPYDPFGWKYLSDGLKGVGLHIKAEAALNRAYRLAKPIELGMMHGYCGT